jgi:putative hydrolase of the HAD superfamily
VQKIILFDIDDTLFPSTKFAELARRNAVRAMIGMGMKKSEEKLHSLLLKIIKEKGSNYTRHFDILCERLKVKQPARFIAAAVAAYHNTKTSIQPYPDTPKTLLELCEKGYKLYIASNGKAIKQWDKLIRLRLALYFEDVFVSGELGVEKGTLFYKKILKTLNSKPQNCIMIGDREDADIKPAKKLGILTIRLKKGKHAGQPSSADFEIDNISQIPRILNSF